MTTTAAQRHEAAVADLVQRQQAVVTRSQLSALGVTSDHVRNQVAARRWTTDGHRVVVLDTGPHSPEQQRWIAVLQQTSGAALAGITAAQADGLRWWAPEQLHILVPFASRIVPTDGVLVHVSRTYSGVTDQHPVRVPPRTRLGRSLIDAASWAPTDRRACGVLCAAVQQRLTTARQLTNALQAAGPVTRRKLIGLTIGDIDGGAASFAEIDMARLGALAGLPPPIRQTVRCDADGKRRYLDVDFGGFFVEVDGALHLLPDSYWEDMQRQNDLVLSGARLLRFPTIALRLEPERVVEQLRRAADRFGSTSAA